VRALGRDLRVYMSAASKRCNAAWCVRLQRSLVRWHESSKTHLETVASGLVRAAIGVWGAAICARSGRRQRGTHRGSVLGDDRRCSGDLVGSRGACRARDLPQARSEKRAVWPEFDRRGRSDLANRSADRALELRARNHACDARRSSRAGSREPSRSSPACSCRTSACCPTPTCARSLLISRVCNDARPGSRAACRGTTARSAACAGRSPAPRMEDAARVLRGAGRNDTMSSRCDGHGCCSAR
jgi:hypothetical protein